MLKKLLNLFFRNNNQVSVVKETLSTEKDDSELLLHCLGPDSEVGKKIAQDRINNLKNNELEGISGIPETLMKKVIDAVSAIEKRGKGVRELQKLLEEIIPDINGISMNFYGGRTYSWSDASNNSEFLFYLAQRLLVQPVPIWKTKGFKDAEKLVGKPGVYILPGRDQDCPICLQYVDFYPDAKNAPIPPFHQGCSCIQTIGFEDWERDSQTSIISKYKNKKKRVTQEMIDRHVIVTSYTDLVMGPTLSTKQSLIIVDFIKENPGFLQKNIYKEFPDLEKEAISSFLYFAARNGKIKRTKKGNSYELFKV